MGRSKKPVLVFILGLFCLSYYPAFSRIITVSKNSDRNISSINKAVKLAQSGDTVWVGGGYYFEENILIDKPLFLFTDENAIIDGSGKFEILSIKSNGVSVKGFCFQNTGHSSIEEIAAVHLYNSNNTKISENCIDHAFFGILLENSNNCVVYKNEIKGKPIDENASGNGIHLWQCDSIAVMNNSIIGHRDGIYLEFVTNSEISHNYSTKNLRYGLHFMFSHSDVYSYNSFVNNGAGVAVMFSKNVDMQHNLFSDNWGNSAFGLLLKEIAGGHINYNTFSGNTTAAYFEGSSRLSLRRNNFTKNGWALKIQASCEDIEIDSNNFISNTFDIATNGTLMLNHFTKNYWDKYEGYDLGHDGMGDVPYQPVSLYSMITERNPSSLLLLRSFLTTMLDRAEKVIPSLTPEKLKDELPLMKPLPL